jgi:hypothetical protein
MKVQKSMLFFWLLPDQKEKDMEGQVGGINIKTGEALGPGRMSPPFQCLASTIHPCADPLGLLVER